MTATAEPAEGQRGLASKLGLRQGLTVQELGYDDDVDAAVREVIESSIGLAMVDEEYEDVVDVVVLWFRSDDGDLFDSLTDAIGPLADHGVVWLFTPKQGRVGHVESEEIADAAPTAGLQATTTVSAARDWQGTRLVAPRAGRR